MKLLRGWLFDNLGLKLTALVLAVLVFLNVITDRSASMLVSFTLDYSELPDSLTVLGSAPSVVQAELRGTGKQLIFLRLREPNCRLPMGTAQPPRWHHEIEAADLGLPAGDAITVESVVGPQVIDVDIDRRVHRDLPVCVRVEGNPAAGWAYGGTALVQPASVRVTGPLKVLQALDTLWLPRVRIEGRRDSLRFDVPLALPDHCSAEPAAVRVRLGFARR